jgi:hypothetical protein
VTSEQVSRLYCRRKTAALFGNSAEVGGGKRASGTRSRGQQVMVSDCLFRRKWRHVDVLLGILPYTSSDAMMGWFG